MELPEILDERKADAQVIRSLINEIRRLTPMPLLQLADGTVIQVAEENYEVITPEQLQERLERLQDKEAQLKDFLGTPDPEVPTAPVSPDNGAAAPDAPTDGAVTPPVPTADPQTVAGEVTPLAGTLPQLETPAAPAAPVAPTDPIQ